MGNFVKTAAAGAVLGGSLLFTVGLGIAGAAPATAGDGKVNLALGNVSLLENVDTAAAAQIAAGVCDSTDTASLTTAVQGVDANGADHVVCTNNLGTISFSQNDTTAAPQGVQGDTAATPQGVQEGAAEGIQGGVAEGTAPHSAAPTTTAPEGSPAAPDLEGR